MLRLQARQFTQNGGRCWFCRPDLGRNFNLIPFASGFFRRLSPWSRWLLFGFFNGASVACDCCTTSKERVVATSAALVWLLLFTRGNQTCCQHTQPPTHSFHVFNRYATFPPPSNFPAAVPTILCFCRWSVNFIWLGWILQFSKRQR